MSYLSNNEENDLIKKRLKEIDYVNPAYFQILSDPKFTLIPTLDSSAREFLNSLDIRSVADLAIQNPDDLSVKFLKIKHNAVIVKEWLFFPGNLSLFREMWDDEHDEEDFDIDKITFPVECSDCHKKIKESDDFLLRTDNRIYCNKCASFFTECQSCSKIFQPDYNEPSYFGEEPEFCPNCENIERSFITYLEKLSLESKVSMIISSWVDLAIDSILHKNMQWYLTEKLKK